MQKYKEQQDLAKRKLLAYEQSVKDRYNIIGIVSFFILFISFLISAAMNFSDITGYIWGIPLAWFSVYGFIWIQTFSLGIDISYEKRKELYDSVVDKDLEKRVSMYHDALYKYEKSLIINKYSVVKAVLCLPPDYEKGIRTLWIVFSNIHLANPRSFPDIDTPRHINDDFKRYYNYVIAKQSHIIPKPKKALNITGEFKFYYPCSDLFIALDGKKAGDEVFVNGVTKYKILEVINFD